MIVLAGMGVFAIVSYYKGWRTPLPAVISGRASVLDGDTVSIGGTHIRLQGIDAPESAQTCTDAKGQNWSCGKTAARELRAHIQGKSLACKTIDFDQYDRVLAICSLPDGSDVNAWMVRQGWAVSYGFSGFYDPEQAQAEAERRGLWAGPFTRPSLWRKTAPE